MWGCEREATSNDVFLVGRKGGIRVGGWVRRNTVSRLCVREFWWALFVDSGDRVSYDSRL